MDFWSRLIGGSRSLSSKALRTRTTTPAERLASFKRTCNTLQQIWRTSNSPSGESSATTHARLCIDRLNSVLNDESRGPAPHPCMACAATSQIYVTVTKLALSSYDEPMLRSAAVFFSTLIDAEVDGVVDNRLFARALVDLVRRADPAREDVEGRLVELLFGVANNIRLQPGILSAWFHPRASSDNQSNINKSAGSVNSNNGRRAVSSGSTTGGGKVFAGATRKDDFPLFYLLIDYVHREGRAGDFARTGLLYVIETASRSEVLERWLIESDLAALMATGLGALYSQLGNLPDDDAMPNEHIPQIIALSDSKRHGNGVLPRLGAPMNSFMSYLLFWQDTIDHCQSAEVNGTLLDHFQALFLEQLLYPSLLESSDVEGGSTSAVLTYLCRILESIDQTDLIYSILLFLLASPSNNSDHPESLTLQSGKDMSVSRRKSLDFLNAMVEEAAHPSPSLFNLRDLALLGLQSTNEQTVLATLRLLTVIIQRHPSFADLLIRTVPGRPAKRRTVGALNAELQQFLSMTTSIVDDPTLDASYDNYLKDAAWTIESRFCIPLPAEEGYAGDGEGRPLELREDDPIMGELLNCLESFFTNTVTINLALTEILVGIASSHLMSLDGWLLVDPGKYDYISSTPPGAEGSKPISQRKEPSLTDIMEKIRFAYQEPSWSDADKPVLAKILQKLVQQVQQWRDEVPDFNVLTAARRDLLHQGEGYEDKEDTGTTSLSPGRSIERQFTTTESSAVISPGRVNSPRGRGLIPQDIGTDSPQQRQRSTTSAATTVGSFSMGSPARSEHHHQQEQPSRNSSASRGTPADELRKRLAMPFRVYYQSNKDEDKNEDNETRRNPFEDGDQQATTTTEPTDGATDFPTLGHVLTNVVILYEFLLELTAVVQVRENLFEEAGYLVVAGGDGMNKSKEEKGGDAMGSE